MTEIVVTVIVRDQDRVLLVQQRKPSAFGTWGYPGGHIEPGESMRQALEREVREEIGASLISAEPLRVDRKKFADDHHFEHHAYVGTIEGGITVQQAEILGFGWFTLPDLERMLPQLREVFIFDLAKLVLNA